MANVVVEAGIYWDIDGWICPEISIQAIENRYEALPYIPLETPAHIDWLAVLPDCPSVPISSISMLSKPSGRSDLPCTRPAMSVHMGNVRHCVVALLLVHL